MNKDKISNSELLRRRLLNMEEEPESKPNSKFPKIIAILAVAGLIIQSVVFTLYINQFEVVEEYYVEGEYVYADSEDGTLEAYDVDEETWNRFLKWEANNIN